MKRLVDRADLVLWLCVLAVVAVRLPFLALPVGSDEAGFLMIADQWHEDSGSLYGAYWVDRPPLLIALHELAGAPIGLRILGCASAAAAVLIAARIGRLVGGPTGHTWTAVVAAAALCAPRIAGPHVSAELLAVPWMLGAIATALAAISATSPRAMAGFAALSGASGAAAILIKQNMIDGALAAAVIVATAWFQRRIDRRRTAVVAAAGLGGGLLTMALVVGAAAWRGTDPLALWDAVFAFRLEAAAVVAPESSDATTERLMTLIVAFVVSGGIAFAATSLVLQRRPTPASLAAVTLFVWAAVSVLASASYWKHNLVQFVPAVVLTTAVATLNHRRWIRVLATYAVAASTIATVAFVISDPGQPDDGDRVGAWLARAADEGDSGVVAWGEVEILHHAGLRSPYEHLWSLPVRTRDPELVRFREVIEGDDPPTWLVVRGKSVLSWAIEPGTTDALIDQGYEVVARTCSFTIHLRRGLERDVPDPPQCATKPAAGAHDVASLTSEDSPNESAHR